MANYYYTDPLAAAWVAKHQGIRFIPDNKAWDERVIVGDDLFQISAFIGFDVGAAYGDVWLDSDSVPKRYFVHPDCVSALEGLPANIITAMKELGMWPCSD